MFVEISLACIHTYPNCCCCCAACTRFGALHLARAASAFATVICISGFGVVRLCLTLSFQSAHGIRKLDVHCCAQGVFCCCCFLQQTAERHRATVYGVRHNFPNFMQWSGNARTILCQSEHETIPPHPKHTHIKKHFFLFMETPCMDLRAGSRRKVIRRTRRLRNPQSTHAPRRRDRRGHNTCLCIPHVYVYRSPLCREQWRLVHSKPEKNLLRLHSWGQRSDWLLGLAVSYCTEQLLTPYFSGASTLNGTRGGDRWERVLEGGQIDWLSEPLRH